MTAVINGRCHSCWLMFVMLALLAFFPDLALRLPRVFG